MPIFGVVGGLALGLLVGGSIDNLINVRLRWLPLLLLGALARFVLDAGLANGSVPDGLRLWLVIACYAFLTTMLFVNRSLSGLTAAAIGTAANGIAIILNGGWMPVWKSSIEAAGLDPNNMHSEFHRVLTGPIDGGFFAHGGPLVDLIPIPLPMLQSVASIGDLLLGAGLGLFVFVALVKPPVLTVERWSIGPGGVAAPLPGVGAGAGAIAAETRSVEKGGPLSHPYVRLATNPAFSAMWLGQIISSLGDRVHQVALVFLVAAATNNSPLAFGLVFAAVTLPSVVVGPFAGTLVDRWDRKRVLIGSDLLRAAIVALIPAANGLHVSVVVVLVFALASVSAFFRPARSAALPQVVPDEDLITANSAMWVADTASDLFGYSLGGLFVAFLGSQLTLAFWVDSASYLASAVLVAAVVIPPLAHSSAEAHASVRSDLMDGWRFLRAETVLFATTIQACVAEYGLGALTALSPLVILGLQAQDLEKATAYGLFEMVIGLGLVAGGLVIGGVADRLPRGQSIVVAFIVVGTTIALLGVTDNLFLALILGALGGVANVTFVIPSQTLFQQRTPGNMLGRVVAMRLAMVNAALALAMVTSGGLAQVVGFRPVLIACGALTFVAGLAGAFNKAIREA